MNSHDSIASSDDSPYTIRRAVEADAIGMAELMSTHEVMRGTLQVPFASPEHWVKLLKSSQVLSDLQLVALMDGKIVGAAGLHPMGMSPRTMHARGLGMGVHPDHWGKGVSKMLMTALLDSADNWLNVKRIQLSVFTDNARAIALYRRYGFEVEGTYQKYALRDGEFVDAIAMARLKV